MRDASRFVELLPLSSIWPMREPPPPSALHVKRQDSPLSATHFTQTALSSWAQRYWQITQISCTTTSLRVYFTLYTATEHTLLILNRWTTAQCHQSILWCYSSYFRVTCWEQTTSLTHTHTHTCSVVHTLSLYVCVCVWGAPGAGRDRSAVPGSVSLPCLVSRWRGSCGDVTIRRTVLQHLHRFITHLHHTVTHILTFITDVSSQLLKHN